MSFLTTLVEVLATPAAVACLSPDFFDDFLEQLSQSFFAAEAGGSSTERASPVSIPYRQRNSITCLVSATSLSCIGELIIADLGGC